MVRNNDTRRGASGDAVNDSSRGVQFDDEQRQGLQYETNTPKIIRSMIKYSGGYIKDEKAATLTTLGFVVVFIIISMLLLFGATRSPSPSIPADPGGIRSEF